MPSHYDVIYLGFLRSPTTGGTPAQAIAKVFGISTERAESIASTVPCVVRWGVTEAVARKYYNAFRYLGAECEFRLSEPALRPAELQTVGTGSGASARLYRPSESDLGLVRANAPTHPIPPVQEASTLGPGITIEEGADTLLGEQSSSNAGDALRAEEDSGEPSTLPMAKIMKPVRRSRTPRAEQSHVSDVAWADATRLLNPEAPANRAPVADMTAAPSAAMTMGLPAQGESAGVVARIREAWERGEDAPLPPLNSAAPFSEWSEWNYDLGDAEFPSEVRVELEPKPPTEAHPPEPLAGARRELSSDWEQKARLLRDIALNDSALDESGAAKSSEVLAGPLFGRPLGTPDSELPGEGSGANKPTRSEAITRSDTTSVSGFVRTREE